MLAIRKHHDLSKNKINVKGYTINNSKVEEIVKSANLIIAHNAVFDRKFVKKQFPIFEEKYKIFLISSGSSTIILSIT